MANSESNGKKRYRTEIVVAIIGLVGALGAALIANWDKVFRDAPPTTPRPDGPFKPPDPRPDGRADGTIVDPVDPVNEPSWDGAWTNIVPSNPMAQSFVVKDPYLTSVSVAITTGNPGRGGDTLIMRIVSEDGEVLAQASQAVAEGFDGWLKFTLPGRGLRVGTGRRLIIELQDSGRVAFGWKYAGDTYAGGSAIMLGRTRADRDFFFRINR